MWETTVISKACQGWCPHHIEKLQQCNDKKYIYLFIFVCIVREKRTLRENETRAWAAVSHGLTIKGFKIMLFHDLHTCRIAPRTSIVLKFDM